MTTEHRRARDGEDHAALNAGRSQDRDDYIQILKKEILPALLQPNMYRL